MNSRLSLLVASLMVGGVGLIGCSSNTTTDAGTDANNNEVSVVDSGSNDVQPTVDVVDSGTTDVTATDTGITDGGVAETGPSDSGSVDANTDSGNVGPDVVTDPLINGCTRLTAMDLRGMASTQVAFGGVALGLTYSPACIVVDVGTMVTFNGSFTSHPLQGGTAVGGVLTPASDGPFATLTNTGTTNSFVMSAAGTFPYYCAVHGSFGMAGVVYVQ